MNIRNPVRLDPNTSVNIEVNYEINFYNKFTYFQESMFLIHLQTDMKFFSNILIGNTIAHLH